MEGDGDSDSDGGAPLAAMRGVPSPPHPDAHKSDFPLPKGVRENENEGGEARGGLDFDAPKKGEILGKIEGGEEEAKGGKIVEGLDVALISESHLEADVGLAGLKVGGTKTDLELPSVVGLQKSVATKSGDIPPLAQGMVQGKLNELNESMSKSLIEQDVIGSEADVTKVHPEAGHTVKIRGMDRSRSRSASLGEKSMSISSGANSSSESENEEAATKSGSKLAKSVSRSPVKKFGSRSPVKKSGSRSSSSSSHFSRFVGVRAPHLAHPPIRRRTRERRRKVENQGQDPKVEV